jgi:hypothetical protein
MWTWAQVVLKILTVVGILTDWIREQNQLSAGEDKAIAASLAGQLAKSKFAKEEWERVNALPEAQVDSGLKGLEP